MKNHNIILLKTLLLSTSQRNIYKHCRDEKKQRKIIGSTIGVVLLYVMLMAYSISICIGYGMTGIIDAAPAMCALVISVLAFLFTIFKTNGYLFYFKEYDMLMALPFESKSIAACKFLYMYIKSLPWYVSISFATMIGYGYFARPAIPVYLIWGILSFFLPVIPMLFAAFLGFFIARVSAGFRKKNIIQTVLTFVFILFCFSLRFIIEGIFKNNQVEQTLEMTSEMTGSVANIYLPVGWFGDAVTEQRISSVCLLIGLSIGLFLIVFYIVGNSYRSINSALKSHAAAKKYRITGQKKRSVVNAIAYKEFKRMTGSTAYMTNAGMGVILASLLGIVTLILGFDRIIEVVTQGAPIDSSMLQPAIPFIIYFFIGMMATTACSPSLEGKNYWIMQSLPVEKKTIYQGKMLFHMYLSVPFMCFSTICLCISANTPPLQAVLYLILGFALCSFSTAWGCVCGMKHMRLDWENEIEVIKQGAAVAIYLLPNMFVVMGLIVLSVFLGTQIDHKLLTIILILIAALLAGICYRRVMTLAKRIK